MIRVLNLFTIMNYGGAESMVMNYYRNIDRSKVQFDFMVHRKEKGAYDDEIRALGGKIYRMPSLHPKDWVGYKKRLRLFFDRHPEYEIIHSHMSENGYFAFKEAKRHGVPVRICHAHSAPLKYKYNAKGLIRYYYRLGSLKYATHLFACGESAGLWLYGKKNKDRITVMPNAIDSQKYVYNKDTDVAVRKELGLGFRFVIGHVGSIKPAKNHEFIVEIFREFQKLKPDSVLILVGEGELKERIKSLVFDYGLSEKVIFTGGRGDVYRLFQCFNAFLFPSLWEGLPVSLIEAQAAGLKCYVSDAISTEGIITENVRSLSLQQSAEEWAAEIYAHSEPYERPNMTDKIRVAGYDVMENVRRLTEFYLSKGKEPF